MDFMQVFRNFQFRNEFWCLVLPIFLMAFDILTGFINAWSKREVMSSKLRTGLSKKVGEIAILVIGELFSFAMKLPAEVMTFISVYIILMELISIIENLDKLGVPIPGNVKNVVNTAQHKLENGDIEKMIEEAHNDDEADTSK